MRDKECILSAVAFQVESTLTSDITSLTFRIYHNPRSQSPLSKSFPPSSWKQFQYVSKEDQWKEFVHILIADLNDNIGKFIATSLKQNLPQKYFPTFSIASSSTEILQLAHNQKVDIFLLILNNILHPGETFPIERRIEKSLELVTTLRTKFKKPVLVLSGGPDDPLLPSKAQMAGANFFSWLPFRWEDLFGSVMQALREEGGREK